MGSYPPGVMDRVELKDFLVFWWIILLKTKFEEAGKRDELQCWFTIPNLKLQLQNGPMAQIKEVLPSLKK